jgi:hypothetical protein
MKWRWFRTIWKHRLQSQLQLLPIRLLVSNLRTLKHVVWQTVDVVTCPAMSKRFAPLRLLWLLHRLAQIVLAFLVRAVSVRLLLSVRMRTVLLGLLSKAGMRVGLWPVDRASRLSLLLLLLVGLHLGPVGSTGMRNTGVESSEPRKKKALHGLWGAFFLVERSRYS